MRVRDDSYDLIPALALVAESYPSPKCAFPRPPVIREGLRDHDRSCALRTVTTSERPALEKVDTHRLEVADFHLIVARKNGEVAGAARMVLDLDAIEAQAVRQRDRLGEAYRFYPALRQEPILEEAVERGRLFPTLDLATRDRDPCRQQSLGVEAGIHCPQSLEAAQHQSRAHEQYECERHLNDDESVP